MGFNYGGINQQGAPQHIPQPSNYNCFNEQAPWTGYMGLETGLIPHEFFGPPHPSLHPCDMRSAILIEIEKERIREEIIISEIIARKCCLEAELMGERELAGQRDVDGYPDGSSPQEVLQSPMSLEWTNGSCESGGFDTSPFQRGNADLSIMEVKAVSDEDKENQKVINLAKADENISGHERKAVMQPEADTRELPSNVVLKGKEEWSCALCQVSTSSEQSLNQHLRGKKHKSKETALTSQKDGENNEIGPSAKKVELKAESLLVEKTAERNPTVSENLKENQLGSTQVQKNGDPQKPGNVGENGSESVLETEKNGETVSELERNDVMQPEADTSVLPSNVVLKGKEDWSCALSQVSACNPQGPNEYLHGKEQLSKEAGLTSVEAADNFEIGLNAKTVELKGKSLLVENAKTVELKGKSLLVEKTWEENPTISVILKENQSGSVLEVQKNGDPPSPNNLGENGFNAKKVEYKAKTCLIKKIGMENQSISDNLKENQSGWVQEAQKNGDTPNPDNFGENESETIQEAGKDGKNISQLPSNVILKVKEDWSCALCQVSATCERGLNEHRRGKKHKSKEAALTSQKAGENYKIGPGAMKVELKAESFLVEKTGERNPAVSNNLKKNQSGSVQGVQKNGNPPNPDNLRGNGSESVREIEKNGETNVVLKVKGDWSCALSQVSDSGGQGINEYLCGKKQQSKEAGLISDKTADNFIIGLNAKTVELKAKSLLVEKTREENPTIAGNLKESQSESVQEVHKNGYPSNPNNLGKNGFNSKKVEYKAKTLLIKKIGMENQTISDNLRENQSGWVQEVQKNGNTPNPDNFGENESETIQEAGKDGKNIGQLPSNVILKVKEEWSCALCQVSATCERGLNEHRRGKKHKFKEAASTSQKAGENYKIGPGAMKVELKAESFLVEKTGERNPTVSDNLKENQIGSIQELQKIGNPPNPDSFGENRSEPVRGIEKSGETRPEGDKSVLSSNVALKVKEDWSFALNQVSAYSTHSLDECLHGMKQQSQEAGLRSDKAADNCEITLNARTVELKAKSLLVEKTREENPIIADNLKENQSESVREVQKTGDPSNPHNLGKNGFNAKKAKLKAKTWLIKKIGMENRTDDLMENQSGWVQDVQKNGDTPNPDKLGENGSETVRENGKSGKNISQPPSNVILKVKEEWRCALCQVSPTSKQDLNEHLQGKKHKSKEAALTSQKAGDNYNIGINANKVELKASSLVVKTVEDDPTISDKLKENQSGLAQKVQKNGDPPNPVNLEESGSESVQETGENCNLMNRKYNFGCEMYKERTVSKNAKDVSVEDKEKLEVIDMAKLDKNISGLERMAVIQSEAGTSEISSNVVLKAKEEWRCALCKVSAGSEQGLNEHLQGKKHKSKECALTSQMAVDNYKIEHNVKDVKFKAKTWLIKETGEKNPSISDNLKENQSESVQEVQKNGNLPNPDNLVENGNNVKDVEFKAKTWRIKRTDVENPAVSNKLKENQSGSIQEVQKNGDPPNPDNVDKNRIHAKEVELKAKPWRIKRTGVENPTASDNLKENLSRSVQETQKNDDPPNPENLGGNGFNAKEVELKAKTWWIKKTGVENPTISDNLKENQSGSLQEVQKNGDPPNPDNLGENGFNAKEVELKAKLWQIKITGAENPTVSDNLKKNQSGSAQEVQKNGDPPHPDNLGENGFNAKEVELKAKTWRIKRTGVENPTISDNLKENVSESVQEVQKNGDPPNPNNLEKNEFNAKKVEFKATTRVMKKTGVRQPTISENLKESPSESVEEVQKNGHPPNRDSIGVNGSFPVQETGRNGNPKNKKYNFWCEMCKVGTISQKDMNEHEKGKKHVNQVRKSDRNGEMGLKLKIWLKKETEVHG